MATFGTSHFLGSAVYVHCIPFFCKAFFMRNACSWFFSNIFLIIQAFKICLHFKHS